MSDDKGTELKRTLSEVALYPPHPPRKPSALYTKNHHQMVVVEDRPCIICGVRNSTLKDPAKNLWGAKAIETHHHVIEDSLANAIDVEKFNKRVLPGLLHRTGNQRYAVPFTQEQMLEWIHGDVDNLWCVCDQHHRGKMIGCHSITGPIWGVQDLLFDGYDLTGFHPHTPEEGKALAALPTTTGTPEPATEPAK